MSISMREKLARAIAEAIEDRFPGYTKQSWDQLSMPARDAMLKRADAALAALSEPTAGMVDAMDEHAGSIAPEYAYRDAIQAAKDGK